MADLDQQITKHTEAARDILDLRFRIKDDPAQKPILAEFDNAVRNSKKARWATEKLKKLSLESICSLIVKTQN